MLAIQTQPQPAQAAAPLDEDLTEEAPYPEEESCLAEETQERDKPEEFYPDGDSEPSLALPSRSFAPPPPVLTSAALYGLAGLVVRGLAPCTEADPAAILLQFLAAFGNVVGPPVTDSISSSSNRARRAKEPTGASFPASSPKTPRLGPPAA